MNPAIYGALGGLVTAVGVSLLGLAGSRSSLLRMLKDETETIAAMPEGSPRRQSLEKASDLYAARYLRHAQEPVRRRGRWLALSSSVALVAVALFQAFNTEGAESWFAMTLASSGFAAFGWMAWRLARD